MRRGAPFALPARLLRDQRGVSAVEFALIAPVMIVIYFGLVEFCQGYMAERRAGHAASMVADLVAQSGGTSALDLDRTFAIGDTIMRPFSAVPLSIRVSSVTVDAGGVATVEWSRANSRNLTRRAPRSIVADLPPGLIEAGQTVILGETEYAYQSAFAQVIPNGVVFRRSYYLRPRTTDRIVCADCPA
jgi:Flp pilus assembly protein TadG